MPGIAGPVQGKRFAVYQIDCGYFQPNRFQFHYVGNILHRIIAQKPSPPIVIGAVVIRRADIQLSVFIRSAVRETAAPGSIKGRIHLSRFHVDFNGDGGIKKVLAVYVLIKQLHGKNA